MSPPARVANVTSAIATMISVTHRQPGEDAKKRGYDEPSTARNGVDHGESSQERRQGRHPVLSPAEQRGEQGAKGEGKDDVQTTSSRVRKEACREQAYGRPDVPGDVERHA